MTRQTASETAMGQWRKNNGTVGIGGSEALAQGQASPCVTWGWGSSPLFAQRPAFPTLQRSAECALIFGQLSSLISRSVTLRSKQSRNSDSPDNHLRWSRKFGSHDTPTAGTHSHALLTLRKRAPLQTFSLVIYCLLLVSSLKRSIFHTRAHTPRLTHFIPNSSATRVACNFKQVCKDGGGGNETKKCVR